LIGWWLAEFVTDQPAFTNRSTALISGREAKHAIIMVILVFINMIWQASPDENGAI
jgi:hypothetical protein